MASTVCMPEKFAALCSKLNEEQVLVVQKIGFGSLLKIPAMPIQRILLESLAEHFNEVDRSFAIQGHVVPINTWDVYCILGVTTIGDMVEINSKKADHKLFDLYKCKTDRAITFKHLEEQMVGGAADDHFARMFALYTIGTILAPASKKYVSSNYLHVVANTEKIVGYNWGHYTLEYLLEHLELFKKKKRTGLAGNLAFLQVWFFEHFQISGGCFNHALHQHPLIQNWGKDKVIKGAVLEGVKKFSAEKVLIRLEIDWDEDIGDFCCTDSFQNKDKFDNDVNEGICMNGSHKDEKGDECHQKDPIESIKDMISSLQDKLDERHNKINHQFDERFKVLEERTELVPQLYSLVQVIVNLLDGSTHRQTSKDKKCRSVGSSCMNNSKTAHGGEEQSVNDDMEEKNRERKSYLF